MESPPALVKLLAIDDDPTNLALISQALGNSRVKIVTTTEPEVGLELVRVEHPDIVLLDLVMPRIGGMEVLKRIVQEAPGTDVVLLTGYYSTESAVEAMQAGACDYLNKPISCEVLRQRIGKLIADAEQRYRAGRLEGELVGARRFEGMVGHSPAMMEMFSRVRRVAQHFRTALILGATGTGKELAAHALHRRSPVAEGPFVVCNCSAVVETLFESELFGYVKGAFTGAIRDKVGLFEYADGGTLFLDELGDLPLSVQAKLLRALQTMEIQKVGSPATRKVNVRVVAATNRNLQTMMAENQFREDLYYRVSMVEMRLPSLADRREDLPLLVRHFTDQFAEQYNRQIRGVTQRALAVLSRHSWPGNVRELENAMGNACMMTDGDIVDVRDLPPYLLGDQDNGRLSLAGGELLPLAEVERRYAQQALRQLGGNKAKTAEALGISRATLYRILNDQVVADIKALDPSPWDV